MITLTVESILKYKLSSRMKHTLVAVVIAGVLAHMYMYMNRIVNHDGVFALSFSGSTITSGRWFLYLLVEIAHIFTSNYITPWGIGSVTILLYAISACVIVKIFNIRSNILCSALGIILITFPSITANNLYIFTAHYYALSVLLACCSVWLVSASRKWYAVLGSGFLLSLSLGIYQAYLPFVLTMYVLVVLLSCLNPQKRISDICIDIFRYFMALLFGLLVYFSVNRLFISIFNTQMDTYMGMNTMGEIQLSAIPSLLTKCYYNFFSTFINDYNGINHKSWLRYAMLLSVLFLVISSGFVVIKNKICIAKTALAFLCIAVLPVAINAIYIMVHDEKGINTMTVYALVFVFIAPVLLADYLCTEKLIRKCATLQLCILMLIGTVSTYYSNLANETYLALEYSNMNVNAYFIQLATQIKSMEDFSPELEVAFVGQINDESLPEINCDYIIRGTFTPEELVNVYSREYFMTMHCGYSCTFADNVEELAQDARIMSMPAYPSNGSIAIIDDIIVVKFS